MQGDIICCTGDNCNTEVPSLPPTGSKSIAISYETRYRRLHLGVLDTPWKRPDLKWLLDIKRRMNC